MNTKINTMLRKKMALIAMLIIGTAFVVTRCSVNRGNSFHKIHAHYDKITSIEIKAPKGTVVQVDNKGLVNQVKKYCKPTDKMSSYREDFEKNTTGTPITISFYQEDKLLFEEKIYRLKESVLDKQEVGKARCIYIQAVPCAVKIDDEWIAINGSDAQVEKYIGELWSENK